MGLILAEDGTSLLAEDGSSLLTEDGTTAAPRTGSGVYRPYSLADVLGSINQQAIGNTDTAVSGVGYFGEVDETAATADTATVTAQVNPAWGAGTWGAVMWS